jgi:hypothetical protein
MFVDHNRHYAWDKLRQRDFRAFAPFLTDQVFERAAYYAGVGLGGGPLGLVVLAWLGVNAALHRDKCFSNLLSLTLKLLRNDPRWDPDTLLPHAPRRPPPPTTARRAGPEHASTRGDPSTIPAVRATP